MDEEEPAEEGEEELEGAPEEGEASNPQPVPAVAAAAEAEVTVVNEVTGEKRRDEAQKLDPRRLIEAALFMSPRPMKTEELGRYIGVAAPGHVEALVKELAADYDRRSSAVMVAQETEGWVMRLRPEYAKKVAPLAQEAEISRGALKILGYISQNEGIEQSKVADRLGSTVYDYVRELVEKGFVLKEKKGRTSSLRTTQKFRDYFGS